MANSRQRSRSPDDRIGGANNQLRIDLYRRLRTQIQEQDQKSGAQGYVIHWNDPDAQWNRIEDIRAAWNAVGLAPIIQTLFYAIETLEGEDLGILENLDCVVDPFNAPEELLPSIAASFGYRIRQDLDVETKRIVVQGLFHAYKSLGQRISFDVFYRMVGFRIIKVWPLWKKDVNESLNRYSRVRYETTTITDEPVGPLGITSYRTILSNRPITPGSVRITDGTVILKDNPEGFLPEGLVVGNVASLLGPTTESGTINYQTGELVVNFAAITAGAVTVTYEHITSDFPFRAARMDVEILMNPGGTPIPLTDSETLRSVLDRLDEARPIHVLLRALTLAFEVSDDVDPTASDAWACQTILEDSRDPFLLDPGLEARYLLDQGPPVRDDDLLVEQLTASVVTEIESIFEERIDGFVCPGVDVLSIEADVDQTV